MAKMSSNAYKYTSPRPFLARGKRRRRPQLVLVMLRKLTSRSHEPFGSPSGHCMIWTEHSLAGHRRTITYISHIIFHLPKLGAHDDDRD